MLSQIAAKYSKSKEHKRLGMARTSPGVVLQSRISPIFTKPKIAPINNCASTSNPRRSREDDLLNSLLIFKETKILTPHYIRTSKKTTSAPSNVARIVKFFISSKPIKMNKTRNGAKKVNMSQAQDTPKHALLIKKKLVPVTGPIKILKKTFFKALARSKPVKIKSTIIKPTVLSKANVFFSKPDSSGNSKIYLKNTQSFLNSRKPSRKMRLISATSKKTPILSRILAQRRALSAETKKLHETIIQNHVT